MQILNPIKIFGIWPQVGCRHTHALQCSLASVELPQARPNYTIDMHSDSLWLAFFTSSQTRERSGIFLRSTEQLKYALLCLPEIYRNVDASIFQTYSVGLNGVCIRGVLLYNHSGAIRNDQFP